MTASTFRYALYGVQIQSDVPLDLPESTDDRAVDVNCWIAPDHWFESATADVCLHEDDSFWYHYGRLADGSDFLRFPDVCEFVVSEDGRAIACRQLRQSTPESFQTYLCGQTLSYALIKQGIEPLHATTIVSDGVAFGLLGRSGLGKSTLAAEFLRAGDSLLTDDMLVMREIDGEFHGFPGSPRIKLYPEIAEALAHTPDSRATMNPRTNKLLIPVESHRLITAPVPVKSFFVLDPSTFELPIAATPMTPNKSVLHLLTGTFNRRLMTPQRLKQQFAMARAWAGRIPVWCLDYPRFLPSLGRVRETILATVFEQEPVLR